MRIGKFPQIKSQHTLALKITRGLALDSSTHFPLLWPQISQEALSMLREAYWADSVGFY